MEHDKNSNNFLSDCGLLLLAGDMCKLAEDYGFAWGKHFARPIREDKDLSWLRRAMAHTYSEISDQDKQKVKAEYEMFLEADKVMDWCAYADSISNPTFIARCYILWGDYHSDKWKSPKDRRVYYEGKAQTICVELRGTDRHDALSKLDTKANEFIEWWS